MAFCSCASSSMLAAAMFCATCSADPDPDPAVSGEMLQAEDELRAELAAAKAGAA